MGYTHYWSLTKIPSPQVIAIVLDQIIKIRGLIKVKIQLCYNDKADPIFTEKMIRFNGIGEDGHEPFNFHFNKIHSTCTKTNYKPYDKLICLILLSLKNHIQGFDFRTDGDQQIWQPIVNFYTKNIRPFNKLQKWDPEVIWNRYKYQTVGQRKQREDILAKRKLKYQQVRRQMYISQSSKDQD